MLKKNNLPRVSICTPTFNRRPFFKGIIQSVVTQKYPKELIEWVIVDDGTDKIEDLVSTIPFVKYFKLTEKMPLGKKRNYMHNMCSFKNDDDIIVYMDDDDYYPPNRVSHAVDKLIHSKALCAGSSELYIWFNTLNKMYKFGPYGPNHSTAGTFAFKRALLKDTHYEDDAVLAEEKYFLKNYTVPFVQLDPLSTILVFSHEQNTFDKRKLIDPANKMCSESNLKVKTFIKNIDMQKFYMDEIDTLLKEYEPGNIKYKPDVLKEIERRETEKSNNSNSLQFAVKNPDGTNKIIPPSEILNVLKFKTEEVSKLRNELDIKNEQLRKLLTVIKEKNLQSFFI
uniref:Glycosyltransferase 2-like domain-containing protein n=1 Tax=viral metagenome TaxID=1070528 RepID=A0A6C0JJV9_9ZZZZ